MKKILLIGAIYYDNLGDAALVQSAENLLSDDFRVKIIDIYGRTEFSASREISPSQIYKQYKKIALRTRIREAFIKLGVVPYDRSKKLKMEAVERLIREEIAEEMPAAMVFAGGALLKGVFLNSVERIVKIAEKYQIPVLFNACGIDSEMLAGEWKKLGRILRSDCVKYISVRDGIDILQEKYPELNIEDTVDPAICSNRIYKKSGKRDGIGLGIMLSYRIDFHKQVRYWESVIDQLNAAGYEWKMFTNGSAADQAFAEYILKRNGYTRSRIFARPEDPARLYYNISRFEMIVSMRLHSTIMAYSSDTPAIAISWDRKLNDFFEKIGKSEYCLDFDSTAQDVLQKIKSISESDGFFSDKKSKEQLVENNIRAIKEEICEQHLSPCV